MRGGQSKSIVPVAGVALTGGVVSNAVEHLRAGSRHHVTGGAPGPAGADPIDGSLAVESRAWRRAGEGGGGGRHKCQTHTLKHISGMVRDYI